MSSIFNRAHFVSDIIVNIEKKEMTDTLLSILKSTLDVWYEMPEDARQHLFGNSTPHFLISEPKKI